MGTNNKIIIDRKPKTRFIVFRIHIFVFQKSFRNKHAHNFNNGKCRKKPVRFAHGPGSGRTQYHLPKLEDTASRSINKIQPLEPPVSHGPAYFLLFFRRSSIKQQYVTAGHYTLHIADQRKFEPSRHCNFGVNISSVLLRTIFRLKFSPFLRNISTERSTRSRSDFAKRDYRFAEMRGKAHVVSLT